MDSSRDSAALTTLVAAVERGDRRALARCLTFLDDHVELGPELLSRLSSPRGGSRMIGITGSPGAGKSTVVDALISQARARGKSVGVLAVDPSSPFSGGAILGDRIRMSRHGLDDRVFVRSLATRGAFGGLSRSTSAAARVMEAAGYEVILIETVGVGQDEVDIARLAHTTVVVLVPGLGDDVQTLKAGLLEVADILLLNKADHLGIDELEASLRQLLALAESTAPWPPPIVRSIATTGQGIELLTSAIERHQEFLQSPPGRQHLNAQVGRMFDRLLDAALVEQGRQGLKDAIDQARIRIACEGADPYAEVQRLVAKLDAVIT
jgi:LAO/AO transport system kinase